MANGVSRAVIEVLLDRVNQGAATLSPAGNLTYANQRLATMLGKQRLQLVGQPLAELVAEADREALLAALAASRDTTSQCRLALPRANHGGELVALLTLAPLGHGQTSCLVTDLAQALPPAQLAQEVRSLLGAMRSSDHHALEAIGRRILELISARQ